jgi:hypothetical protein
MSKFESNVITFLLGMMVMGLLVLSTVHIRDTGIIKMYTEDKIVCTTLADEFICREVEKE